MKLKWFYEEGRWVAHSYLGTWVIRIDKNGFFYLDKSGFLLDSEGQRPFLMHHQAMCYCERKESGN